MPDVSKKKLSWCSERMSVSVRAPRLDLFPAGHSSRAKGELMIQAGIVHRVRGAQGWVAKT